MLGWDQYSFLKNVPGHIAPSLCFAFGGIYGHVGHSGASEACNVDALIFMLEWARCGFHNKRTGIRDAEVVFLHPVGSEGHIVHSVHPGHETLTDYFSSSGGTSTDFRKNVSRHVTPNLYFCIR
jgi:hypothetical protein